MTNACESTLMYKEAASAHVGLSRQALENKAVLGAIRASFARHRPPVVITCARGSSDHAATYLRYVLETRLGLLTASFAPSVSSIYAQWPHVAGCVCVVISQSGHSHDLLAVASGMRRIGMRTIAIVNDCESPLAKLSQFVIPLHAGTERSVAATKSFIASLFASLQFAQCMAPRLVSSEDLMALPGLMARAWALDWTPLVEGLLDARGLYVIGRGAGLAIAQEAALKFKETCNLHAEAFSAAEVRHGPMALFERGFPILIFRQRDATADDLDALARVAADRGCRVFVVGGTMPGMTNLETVRAPAVLEPILQIQAFYKAVNSLSLRRGHDPDHPALLRKVTVTL